MSGHDATTAPAEVTGTTDHEQAVPSQLPALEVDDEGLRRGIGAVLFISDEPVGAQVLSETLGVDPQRVEAALHELAAATSDATLGFELREVAGGWRLLTAPSARDVLERWLIGARHGRLTQAALETLAVVAYRQPIARATIGEIRGVNPDGALRSLVSRGLVTEVGREDGPGQAVLFGTTREFLERMGLRSLDELPPVPPYLPDGPAPDEPDASGLADLRRRLRDGSARLGQRADGTDGTEGEGPGTGVPGAPLIGAGAQLRAAGAMEDSDDEDLDVMPAPVVRQRPADDGTMGALSERLEQAARSAMGRLRNLRTEQAAAEADDDASDGARTDEPVDSGRPDEDGVHDG